MSDGDASVSNLSASDEVIAKRPAPTINASRATQDASASTATRNVFLFLVAFRIVNALCIRTFFQPDEYFQSLEPAWDIAFGPKSGAWITWEWKHDLRSTFHPYVFAGVYKLTDLLSSAVNLDPSTRANLLVAAPKVLQACIAATGDYYTWKLGERVYGTGSYGSWTAMVLSVCSAWQWFCSTRTFSNCLETTLTVIALEAWPWHLASGKVPAIAAAGFAGKQRGPSVDALRMRQSMITAAVACVLRPTNILIWLVLGSFLLYNIVTTRSRQEAQKMFLLLAQQATLSGILVLLVTSTMDSLYYQHWTFPPLRFLYYNVVQSLAIFYGGNDWHYYLSQGYPLLLTTYLPFAGIALYEALSPLRSHTAAKGSPESRTQLAIVCITIPLALSLIAHKEVRFIYPLLPILHVLSAPPAIICFEPALRFRPLAGISSWSQFRPWLLILVLGINIHIAIFTTQSHQLGPLSVMTYLRHEHEAHFLSQPPPAAHFPQADTTMTVGFLMPCHSTPWRSHLVHPGIKAWALGCEPPIDLDPAARSAYLDEADQFYADPKHFLKANLGNPPKRKTVLGNKLPQQGTGADADMGAWDGKPGRKIWPQYLVFFEALEPTMKELTKNSGYAECWRGWSSWVHDDSRRKGDVVVWRLHGPENGGH